jgi:hypothetical protein
VAGAVLESQGTYRCRLVGVDVDEQTREAIENWQHLGAAGIMSSRVIGMRHFLALVAFLLLALVSAPALATDSQNRCHDLATMADWEKLLSENPKDPVVIRLYGLRRGVCSMIDEALVQLDQAIEIFNTEHAKGVVERYNEEQGRERELRL